jgi:cobalt-zinc-cadmium efflux system outer membrane protein
MKFNARFTVAVRYRIRACVMGYRIACAAMLFVAGLPPAVAADLRHLSLDDAISLAIHGSRDIRLAAISVDNAAAAVIAADAAPNPTLTWQTASINPHSGLGAGSLRDKTVDTTIRIDQTIERGGKRELRRQTALHQEQAVRADRDEAVRQIRLAAAQAYYDLLAAQERLAIADDNAALYQQTLQAAQRRKKAGDLSGADMDRITVDALKARSDSRLASADVTHARMALAMILGDVREADLLYASDPWPAPAGSGVDVAIDRRIEARPDVKAARARLDAAIEGRRLALASRTRDISVGMQFEHAPSSDANPTGSGNSYGISVQIPLFVRYRFEGEIRAAEAAVDSARETLEKVRDAARLELERARRDVETAAARVSEDQQAALVAAGRAADAAEYAFKNGASGVMEVLDARRAYRTAQMDALSARADLAKALIAWRQSLVEESEK